MTKQRIRLTEGQLNRVIKESVKRVLHESADFYDFAEILERNGWSYVDYQDVTIKDGRTGTRYRLSGDWIKGSPKPVPYEQLESELKDAFGNDIIFSNATYRYAPEIKAHTVIVLD